MHQGLQLSRAHHTRFRSLRSIGLARYLPCGSTYVAHGMVVRAYAVTSGVLKARIVVGQDVKAGALR